VDECKPLVAGHCGGPGARGRLPANVSEPPRGAGGRRGGGRGAGGAQPGGARAAQAARRRLRGFRSKAESLHSFPLQLNIHVVVVVSLTIKLDVVTETHRIASIAAPFCPCYLTSNQSKVLAIGRFRYIASCAEG
jgi:hypothetical protein